MSLEKRIANKLAKKLRQVKTESGERTFNILKDMFNSPYQSQSIVEWWYAKNDELCDMSPHDYVIEYGQHAVFEKLWENYQ
jgi:hypothetical protein